MLRFSKRTLLLVSASAIVFFGVLALHIHRNKSAKRQDAAVSSAKPPVRRDTRIAPDSVSETKPWPCWGGALNSAELNGQFFFDRVAARAFRNSIEPNLRAYVVELNSRSFLPVASGGDVFSGPDANRAESSPRTAYLQFLTHPTDAQRAALSRAGVELLMYVSGYAWVARGSAESLLHAGKLPFTRAIARIDARDKLQRDVFLQQTPAYAQTTGAAVRFQWIAARGTSLETMTRELHSFPELTGVEVQSARVSSTLGPRFEASARADLAGSIAAAEVVMFVGYAAPPVAPRDATTDASSNIAAVRDAGDHVDGTGVNVAVREIGKPLSHVDFASRLMLVDNDGDTSNASLYEHATAVVGQVASNGVNQPAAKGVAPGAHVLVYSLMDGDFATADIVDAASKNARISNHSYGPIVTLFGDYTSISADWDDALRSTDSIAFFAGNEEGDAAKYNHIDFFVGMKNGLCLEASSAAAKAGNAFSNPPVSKSDGSAFFAKYGPMNDGRVKPDLVAFGDGVTLDSGTNSTTINSGTSFSTPVGTGVAALVFQRYKAVFGKEPTAALAKALLCESASDLGAPGPDSVYGFGILNAQEAVRLIDLRQSSAATPFVEDTVSNGDVRSIVFNVPSGTSVFKATLCWMDPAGNPAAAKALVNDLDMLLIDPGGNAYFPYSLDPAAPAAPATNSGPNTVDPIEQTIVTAPAAGMWTIKIMGTSIPAGTQSFAVSANLTTVPAAPAAFIEASPTEGDSPLSVSFDGTGSIGNIVSYQWDFGDGTSGAGATVSHVYTFTGQAASSQKFTATLTVTDSQNVTSTTTIDITVGKPAAAISATTIVGAVNLRLSIANYLRLKLNVPSLIHAQIPAGSAFTVRAGNGIDNRTFFTFVVNAHGAEQSPAERIKIDTRTGSVVLRFGSRSTDLIAFYESLGIAPSTQSLTTPFQIQIETTSTLYSGQFTLKYKGRKGHGNLMLSK